MNAEFEMGQQVAVSDVSIKRALENFKNEAAKYYYLFTQADDQVVVKCVKPGSVFSSMFVYAVAIPEGENKMTEEFEIGQQVAASNESIEVALKSAKDDVHKYYYLVTLTNGSVIVRAVSPDGSDFVSCFNYIAAVPDTPKVTMFTHKTFPRGLVYVREKDSPALVESESLVLGIRQNTIATSSGSHTTYARLAESLEMSLDNGKSWVPCGELE